MGILRRDRRGEVILRPPEPWALPLPPLFEPLRRRDRLFVLVAGLSLVFALFVLAYLRALPPSDADAYEYAGVARSFLRQGQFLHTMIPAPGYLSPIQDLPQPSFDRVTLWTFLLLPFQAILGDSIWVFLGPYLVTFFLLPVTVYLVARGLFSREVAFASSIASALLPRIVRLSTSEDPGQPNLLAAILFLLALRLFVSRRWLWAGGVTGLAILTRFTGIVLFPVFLAWLLLFDRKALTRRGVYLALATAVLIVSPLAIRGAVLFGPRLGSFQDASVLTVSRSLVERWREYQHFIAFSPPSSGEEETGELTLSPTERLKIAWGNLWVSLAGKHTGITWYPGLPEVLTLVLCPFSVWGAWIARRDPARFLIVLFACFLVVFFSSRMGYEDRYLFPAAVGGVILAFHGAEGLAGRFPWISVRSLLVLFLLVEAVPNLGQYALELGRPEGREAFRELAAACEWAKAETPVEAVFMTVPFWSPHYLCDRKTVLPVLGGMSNWKTIVDRYGVDYFLFSEFWGGDQPPRFSFLRPLLLGKHHVLYRIDRSHPDYVDLERRYSYMGNFDFLGYFWRNRFTRQADPPVFRALAVLFGSGALGLTLYATLCFLLLRLVRLRRRRHRYPAYALASLGLLSLKVAALVASFPQPDVEPPPISQVQAARLLDVLDRRPGVRPIALVEAGEEAALARFFQDQGLAVSPSPGIPDPGADPDLLCFVPVLDARSHFSGLDGAREAHARASGINRESNRAAEDLAGRGWRAEVVGGGVLGVPPDSFTSLRRDR